ncbi:MAG: hypothetical protein HYT87_07000 [Nitrospirae bacterium]|nr:hypothetical protein [Nitrospirota bacterium]
MRLVILFHMHQPLYQDPISGRLLLPWVRLHAIHGYHDVLTLIEREGVKITLNITPSLLKQLDMYVQGTKDAFELLTEKPAGELTPADRKALLMDFFSCNPDTMIQPYPRYWELFKKRGKRITPEEMEDLAMSFTKADLCDLQVWFNLTWFGFTALESHPDLTELVRKGTHFTEKDKVFVLDCQREILKESRALHRRILDKTEVSTSPLHHPVLPLLLDTGYARRCMPSAPLPAVGFSYPDDAEAQIDRGLRFIEEKLKRPVGMWPSEGSMCPELIPVLASKGVRWVMTDQALMPSGGDHRKAWRTRVGNGDVVVFFRDRAISDALGFKYHKMHESDAVNDFERRLATARGSGGGVLSLALDGENPWEYYPWHGGPFLKKFVEVLKHASDCELVTPSDVLADPRDDIRETDRIQTGSWIDGKFEMWIGQAGKNRAWEILAKTRGFLARRESTPEAREKALERMYAAEGSDWFWWYGDSFHTDQADTFDLLFRNNLIEVYNAVGCEPPPYLLEPVRIMEESRGPVGFISPRIDGLVSGYAEWYAAGSYECRSDPGRLAAGVGYLNRIYYGFDSTHLYLRLDPAEPEEEAEDLHVHLVFGLRDFKILPLEGALLSRTPEGGFAAVGKVVAARQKVIEMSVPLEPLQAPAGTRVYFVVEVRRKGQMEDRYPRLGFLSFDVPPADFEDRMWSV